MTTRADERTDAKADGVARSITSLDDTSARAEARRLVQIVKARWSRNATWIGVDAGPMQALDDGASPLELGMLAMFRYARGVDVPAFIVQDFVDTLLVLMFAGLGSGALAIPSVAKMRDRPWAMAWRLAELRLKAEGDTAVRLDELAHLLGWPEEELRTELRELAVLSEPHAADVADARDQALPVAALRHALALLSARAVAGREE